MLYLASESLTYRKSHKPKTIYISILHRPCARDNSVILFWALSVFRFAEVLTLIPASS